MSTDAHKALTQEWGDMSVTPAPASPTRTMVRLTGMNGYIVLVDPFDVIKVDTWNGKDPYTVVIQRAPAGATAVRETPTEVNNLLARAGVRIIGADDDRGIGYGEFIAQMSRTVDTVQDCAADTHCVDCEFELSKCTCGDICEGCGNYRDECSDKGICPDVPPPPPAPAPGKGAR
jgi:hypothetical protein